MFKCKDIDLIGFLRQEISTGKRETIRQHLSVCPDCQREVKRLEGVLTALKGIEEIEPSSNFTYRVMQEAEKVSEPLTLTGRFSSLWSVLNSGIQASREWLGTQLKMKARYISAWLISAAIHIILFAILTLILIGPTRQQLSDTYVIKWLPPQREKEIISMPSEMKVPIAKGPIRPTPDSELRPGIPDETVWEHPEAIMPSFEHRPKPVTIIPPSIWSRELSSLDQFNIKVEKRFLSYISDRKSPRKRRACLRKYGGHGVEKAVTLALTWLNQTQENDGSWAVEKYEGRAEYKIGLTALALLSFLSEGNTSQSGPYRATVERGIKYLLAHQQPNGLIGQGRAGNKEINYMYNHTIATLVLLENYHMTGREELLEAIKQAVRFILYAQNEAGGWGYQAHNGINDTSVTCWQIPALKFARALKITGVAQSLKKASTWLASITNEKGEVGYRQMNQYPNGYYALTAAGMFAQLLIDWKNQDALIQAQEKILLRNLPQMHPVGCELDNDFYYWYFGSLAMFQKGGAGWQKWNQAVKKTLVQNQITSGPETGSWKPRDRWSAYGGRIYTTSMANLTLQVYYRYSPSEK